MELGGVKDWQFILAGRSLETRHRPLLSVKISALSAFVCFCFWEEAHSFCHFLVFLRVILDCIVSFRVAVRLLGCHDNENVRD